MKKFSRKLCRDGKNFKENLENFEETGEKLKNLYDISAYVLWKILRK